MRTSKVIVAETMQHFYEFFREHAVAIALALLLAIPANGATHTVVNEVNYHTFSKDHPVLLRIRPGDTVITKTVDSAGFDAEGVRHTKTHGNPLTGPFYVEGAKPGDAVVVRLKKLRLNRATGYSGFHVSSLSEDLRTKYSPGEYTEGAVLPARQDLVPFVIDLKNGTARPKQRLSRHVDLTFAATPMLGCIGVAPADQSPTSGPAGSYGGNLDYKEIREGATVLLPVSVPGAYLFPSAMAMLYRGMENPWGPESKHRWMLSSRWNCGRVRA